VEGNGGNLIGCKLLDEALPLEPACSWNIRKEMETGEVMKLQKIELK
jgi:hypothetical protein